MNVIQTDIQNIIKDRDLFLPLRDSSVLVTGATGLIGSVLVKSLIAANEKYGLKIKVYGQVRDLNKAKKLYGDVFNYAEFSTELKAGCDHIIHSASPTASKYFIENPVETIKFAVGSTIEVLEAARRDKASVVYLSSMEQYGRPYKDGQVMNEGEIGVIDHLSVRSSYSESKRLCECLCASYSAEYGVDVKISRLAQTFGVGAPLTDGRMPMQFARAAAEGKDIVLHTDGRSMSNFVYLTDAITGILIVLIKGERGQAYNVCNDSETITVREIAELVSSEVADGLIKVVVDKKDGMGYAPDVIMYLDSSKLRALGWKAEVGMADAYRKLACYIREAENGETL